MIGLHGCDFGNPPQPRCPHSQEGTNGKWDNCETLCKSLPLRKDPHLAVLAAVVTACAYRQMPAQPVPYHRKQLRGQMQTVIWQLSRAGELLGSWSHLDALARTISAAFKPWQGKWLAGIPLTGAMVTNSCPCCPAKRAVCPLQNTDNDLLNHCSFLL